MAAQNKEMPSGISRKAKALWQDKRPWHTRLGLAAACAFTLCFTAVFYGPVELTAYNTYSLGFTVKEIWPMMALAALAGTAVLALPLSALRGRLFDYALCILFALTLGCYVQGNFLNGSLGELTGDRIAWEDQTMGTLANFALWCALLLLTFGVYYFAKRYWKRILCGCCALVVLMQLAGLAFMGAQGLLRRTGIGYSRSYLTEENLYNFSSQKNIIVIMLDRLDASYIEGVVSKNPDFLNFLDGFTSYTNAVSPFMRTLPGENAILTGYTTDVYRTYVEDHFNNSWDWEGRHLLTDLTDSGYSIDIYTQRDCMFGTSRAPDGYVRNAVSQESGLDYSGTLRALLRVSAYRCAPTVFRPVFWTYTDAIRNTAIPKEGEYKVDDILFSNGLCNVQVGQEQDSFRFICLNGSHAPYTITAEGLASDAPTSAEEQTMGCLLIVKELFDRLKQLGLYEDATIIITADHGYCTSDGLPQDRAVLIGMFYKPSGSAGTPLAFNNAPVSNVNIPATILKNAGADYSAYGPALDEIAPDAQVVRYFYKPVHEHKQGYMKSTGEVYVYRIGQDASDFSSWELIDIYTIVDAFL